MSNALRTRFEELAYEHYKRQHARGTVSDDTEGKVLREDLFWREKDGTYGVRAFNSAWWGYQAGFVDAVLCGPKKGPAPQEAG